MDDYIHNYINESNCINEISYMNGKYFGLKYLKENPELYYSLPDSLKVDKKIISISISKKPTIIKNINKSFLQDKEIIELALSKNNTHNKNICKCMYDFIPENIKNDRDFILYMIEKYHICICFISDNLKDDFEIGFKSLLKESFNYNFLSKKLKNEKIIALKALSIDSNEFIYLPKKLLSNYDFMMKALHINPCNTTKYISYILLENKNVIYSLIKNNNYALNYYDNNINKRFFFFFMLLLNKNENIYCHNKAGSHFQLKINYNNYHDIYYSINIKQFFDIKYNIDNTTINDKLIQNYINLKLNMNTTNEIIYPKDGSITLNHYPYNILNSSSYFQKSKEYVLNMIKYDFLNYEDLDLTFKMDVDVIKSFILKKYDIMKHIPEELKYNKEIILIFLDEMIKNQSKLPLSDFINPYSVFVNTDEDIMLKLIQLDFNNFELASSKLTENKNFISKALLINKKIINFLYNKESLEYIKNNYSMLLEHVSNNGKLIKYLPEKLLTNEILKAAVNNNFKVIKHIPEKLFKKEYVKIALNNNARAILYSPKKYRDNIYYWINAIEKDDTIFNYFPFHKDKLIVKNLLFKNINILNYIHNSKFAKNDILEAIERSNSKILHLKLLKKSNILLSYKIKEKAIIKNPENYKYLPSSSLEDEKLLYVFLDSINSKKEFKEINEDINFNISKRFLSNREIFLKILKSNILIKNITWIPINFRNDVKIIIFALMKNENNLFFASKRLRRNKSYINKNDIVKHFKFFIPKNIIIKYMDEFNSPNF